MIYSNTTGWNSIIRSPEWVTAGLAPSLRGTAANCLPKVPSYLNGAQRELQVELNYLCILHLRIWLNPKSLKVTRTVLLRPAKVKTG